MGETLVDERTGADLEIQIAEVEPRLFGLALRLSRSRDRAEDLVQETFLRGLASLSGYRGDAPLYHWLARILVNVWRDKLRKRDLEEPLDADVAARVPDELATLVRDETEARVERALGQLSPLQRATLLLRSRVGLSYAEIATALGISISSVKVHIHHARTRLAERV